MYSAVATFDSSGRYTYHTGVYMGCSSDTSIDVGAACIIFYIIHVYILYCVFDCTQSLLMQHVTCMPT